jgi:glutamate--cysteine ligase
MTDLIDLLEGLYATREEEIEAWLGARRADAEPFIYTSVDLRHSGPRLVPVDTNLFPAGFNNLSPAARDRAARMFVRVLEERGARRVLIVPENHTRNLMYLENLAVLTELLTQAGAEVRLGSLAAQPGEPIALTSSSGIALTEYPLLREGDTLRTEDGFTPQLIVSNNDFTAASPELLEGLAQPVEPPVALGWHRRRKSTHFWAYDQEARAFAEAFALDPWRIGALFHRCGHIDFKERSGVDALARAVDDVLEKARRKHAEYGITEDPYVYVKADSGTYGMGIMNVRSGSEILEMNKKDRNKMQVIKEGTKVSEVIVQEGIPSMDTVDGSPAEPMIYLVDGVPVGGMYRINPERDRYANLNAPGMRFAGMCDESEPPDCDRLPVTACHFRAYGLVAALAALAAPRELYGVNAAMTAAAL